MTTGDIESHMRGLYDIGISDSTISRVTDKILPILKEWPEHPLEEVEWYDKWDSKYPKIYKSWHDNWAILSTYFKYPEAVRRLIYTTNAIEGFNRQLRKVTKSKTIFPSDDSLLKMLWI